MEIHVYYYQSAKITLFVKNANTGHDVLQHIMSGAVG